jgi:uncharacterized SAM-binding protein YcdF (DUF218 family)
VIPFNTLLPQLFLPSNVAGALVVVGLWRRRPRVAWAGVVLVVVCAHPFTAFQMMRAAEGWAGRRPVELVRSADAVVVLSYGRSVPQGDPRVVEWQDPDRFFGGLDVFRAGKAPRLIFTGSAVSTNPSDTRTEGGLHAALATELGVPGDAIRVTGRVVDTASEAREVLRLLAGEGLSRPKVILVTTAWHLPRARAQFERAGFVVEPFPVDFRSASRFRWTWGRILPTLASLGATEVALREFYGRGYFTIRAWLAGE